MKYSNWIVINSPEAVHIVPLADTIEHNIYSPYSWQICKCNPDLGDIPDGRLLISHYTAASRERQQVIKELIQNMEW